MIRRIAIVLFILLTACGVPALSTPTAAPRPTTINLPTQPPVAPTILPSDFGKLRPSTTPVQQGPAPTSVPPTTVVPQAAPSTPIPQSALPSAAQYAVALRPPFQNDINLISGMTLYEMKWDVSPDASALNGTQRVTFTNRTGQPLNEIFFRLFANYPGSEGKIDVSAVRIGGNQVQTELQVQNTALRVPLTTPLAPNASIQIELDYTVSAPTNDPVRYSEFTHKDWITTLPTIYPLIPAYDDKGWHLELPPPYGDLVYADSSIYDVTITTPAQYNVIASGQLVQETKQRNQVTRHFIGAPMRDFHADVSNTLVKSSNQLDGVTVNSWYLPIHADAGKRALDWVVNAMQIYQNRFGPYPFKELDLVETPTSAGGIEYPGLITVASNLYADPGQLNFFEFATVHETAHQWFYSIVGNDQVNHPWLDESLVEYASLIYFQDRYGPATGQQIQEMFFDKQYEAARTKYGDRPVGLPISAYDEEAYGAFIYAKGPKFYQAVRAQIGDALFFKALQTYYQKFKYRIAQPQDIVDVFNQVSGQDITPLYNKWIQGS